MVSSAVIGSSQAEPEQTIISSRSYLRIWYGAWAKLGFLNSVASSNLDDGSSANVPAARHTVTRVPLQGLMTVGCP
jgi:hypothetical protein